MRRHLDSELEGDGVIIFSSAFNLGSRGPERPGLAQGHAQGRKTKELWLSFSREAVSDPLRPRGL